MTSRSTSHNWAWGAALVAALLAPLVLSNDFILHMMTLWAIYSLLALSLNIIIGYLGELSFGHAAFFGIGAYTSALLVMNLGLPIWWGPLIAGLVAGLFGMAIGFVALRIVGPQFAILTLGFGAILQTITNYWVDVTRGPMGISQIPAFRIDSLGLDFALAQNMYFLALGFLVLGIYVCRALERSRTGRAYVAVRENAELAQSIGINAFRTKWMAFTVATAMAGVGGSLYGHYLRVITPDLMSLSYMSALVIMVIVGGKGTTLGPIIGALVYIVLLEWLRAVGSWRMVVFATLLIGCVLFLPGGLVSLWQRLVRKERA
jgi:branched-chain amino acid transport system permease protein